MKDYAFIPSDVHGILDYALGSAMTIGSFFINSQARLERPAERYIPLIAGTGATTYSLFTNYQYGIVRKIPLKVHLAMDIASGAFLVASPLMFKMSNTAKAFFIGLGIFEIMAGLFTKKPSEPAQEVKSTNYLDMKLEDLREIGKEKNISNVHSLNKKELVKALEE